MLWQGQEFGENYFIPESGWGRVMMFRPVRWDYFYDPIGKSFISLVRKLVKLRRQQSQFRHGNYFFYNHYERYQFQQILLFSRYTEDKFSLIALNFSDSDRTFPSGFPSLAITKKNYTENTTSLMFQVTKNTG